MEVTKLLPGRKYYDKTAYDAHFGIKKKSIIESFIPVEENLDEKKEHNAPPERGWSDVQDYTDKLKKQVMVQGTINSTIQTDRTVEIIYHHGIPGVVDFDDRITIIRDGMERGTTYKLVAREITNAELFTHVNFECNLGRALYGAVQDQTIEWCLPLSEIDKARGKDPVRVKARISKIERE